MGLRGGAEALRPRPERGGQAALSTRSPGGEDRRRKRGRCGPGQRGCGGVGAGPMASSNSIDIEDATQHLRDILKLDRPGGEARARPPPPPGEAAAPSEEPRGELRAPPAGQRRSSGASWPGSCCPVPPRSLPAGSSTPPPGARAARGRSPQPRLCVVAEPRAGGFVRRLWGFFSSLCLSASPSAGCVLLEAGPAKKSLPGAALRPNPGLIHGPSAQKRRVWGH